MEGKVIEGGVGDCDVRKWKDVLKRRIEQLVENYQPTQAANQDSMLSHTIRACQVTPPPTSLDTT